MSSPVNLLGQSSNAAACQQWPQLFKQALNAASQVPQPHGTGSKSSNGRQISVRRMVFSQAEAIIAVHAQGVSYCTIAENLSKVGIPVNEETLRRYISSYRKQKGQPLTAHGEKLSLKERMKDIKF